MLKPFRECPERSAAAFELGAQHGAFPPDPEEGGEAISIMVGSDLTGSLRGSQALGRAMLPVRENVAELLAKGFGQRPHFLAQITASRSLRVRVNQAGSGKMYIGHRLDPGELIYDLGYPCGVFRGDARCVAGTLIENRSGELDDAPIDFDRDCIPPGLLRVRTR